MARTKLSLFANVSMSAAYTTITWTKILEDSAGAWNAETPKRLTVPAGVAHVRVTANMCFSSTSAHYATIRKNTEADGDIVCYAASNTVTDLDLSTGWIPVTAGDYFIAQGHSGTAIQSDGTELGSWFMMETSA